MANGRYSPCLPAVKLWHVEKAGKGDFMTTTKQAGKAPYKVAWAIVGKRPNGEVLYYVNGANGVVFVPCAYSIAYIWRKRDVALREVENMCRQFKGLAVSLEQRREIYGN